MNDTITINDLEVWTNIGCSAQERGYRQRLLITVELLLSTERAGVSDDLNLTIDYSEVAKDVVTLAAKERQTIEALAEDLAVHIRESYSPKQVKITVTKFVLKGARDVRLSIVR